MNLQLSVDTDLNAQAIESRPSTAPPCEETTGK
jgi:hypothetical protein